MEIWTCDACGREFGKRQSHVCAPALSVDDYFGARPRVEREIFEAVRDHLDSLGPCIVEPVGIGILFKTKRTFAELRPKSQWVDLSFGLNYRLQHPRITRTTKTNTARTYHGTRIRSAEDIDDVVRGWLTASYVEFASQPAPR